MRKVEATGVLLLQGRELFFRRCQCIFDGLGDDAEVPHLTPGPWIAFVIEVEFD